MSCTESSGRKKQHAARQAQLEVGGRYENAHACATLLGLVITITIEANYLHARAQRARYGLIRHAVHNDRIRESMLATSHFQASRRVIARALRKLVCACCWCLVRGGSRAPPAQGGRREATCARPPPPTVNDLSYTQRRRCTGRDKKHRTPQHRLGSGVARQMAPAGVSARTPCLHATHGTHARTANKALFSPPRLARCLPCGLCL
jgi:hypothetical protein